MANRCEICGKDRQTGNLVSHSNIKSHHTWKANIQKVKRIVNGTPKYIKICTRCLRSQKMNKAAV